MIGVALDPAVLPIAVAGRGDLVLRRFRALRAGGARSTLLFTDRPDAATASDTADALRPRLPDSTDLAALRALWIAGLPDDRTAELASLARGARVLVNVEDQPDLCDFHSVAEVRRGDLLLTVSTGGASPRLAARIRARLTDQYGPEWADRLALLRQRRAAWQRDRHTPSDIVELTDALLQSSGWLG
jgi:precorrin-2 dehydrogenase/sirohydrochlorin ferrochelatase